MTQITKQILAIMVLVAVGSVSGMVWAQDRPALPDRALAFCQRVQANKGDEASLLSELENVATNARELSLKRLQDRKAEQASQIRELRDSAQFELKTNIRNLSSRARTPEQKSAVANFDSKIEKALATRNAIVDGAQETFRNNFNRIVRERQARMVNAVATFRSEYSQIFRTAVNDCAVVGGAIKARENFLSSAKTIRQNLVVQLSPSQSIADTKPLAIARNLLIKEANDRFLAELKVAEKELRASF